MGDDGEPVAAIACAVELRAEPGIFARCPGFQPQRVDVAGHGVELSGQARHPEAVDDIRGGDLDVDGAARGDVQHVLGHAARHVRIGEGPRPLPPLRPHGDHIGPRPREEPLAHPQAVGEERGQHDERKPEPEAPDEGPLRAVARLRFAPERQSDKAEDKCEDQGAPGEHHPP